MAKTKALISFEVTAKLIRVFVFEYADRLFSHEAAQFYMRAFQYTCTCHFYAYRGGFST